MNIRLRPELEKLIEEDGLPHSKASASQGRPLQRRFTVVRFGCDIWGTNAWRSSYHVQASGCARQAGSGFDRISDETPTAPGNVRRSMLRRRRDIHSV